MVAPPLFALNAPIDATALKRSFSRWLRRRCSASRSGGRPGSRPSGRPLGRDRVGGRTLLLRRPVAEAGAGSGCQGVPRPTRDAVSREAQRLAVGSAGADLEAVLRCWFPSGSRRLGCRMTRRRGTSGARRGPRRRGRGRRLGAFRAAARRESRPVLFGSAIELGPSRRRSTDRQHRGAAGREADEVPAVGGGHRDVR